MKIYIKTLTPVHIGTGNEIEKFEYRISDNKFLRINFSKLSEMLMERFPDKFTEWINKVASNNENVSIILSLPNIKKQISGNEKIENEINKSVQYKLNTNFSPDKKVRENIKTGNNELYIPGTSLKGSIRTALLSDALKRIDENTKTLIVRHLSEKVKDIREKEKSKKYICDFVENEIYYCGIKKIDNNNRESIKYSDEKFDLMKLIQISDSSSISSDEYGEISNLSMFKLKNDQGTKLLYSESISINSYFEFEIRIDKEFILKAKDLLNNNDKHFGKKEWINFKIKFERLFDLKLNDLNRENIDEEIINKILIAINEMGRNVFNREKQWIDSLNGKVESQFIKNFYSRDDFSSSMKIGYGSSFLATTIFLWMYNNISLKTELDKVLKFFGIGKHRNGNDVDINNFPFTRKYENNNNEISPLGWIQLSKTEFPKITENIKTSNLLNIDRKLEKKENWYEAEIKKITPKPIMIKILDNDFKGIELKLQYGNVSALSIGKRLYVTIEKNKKQIKDSRVTFEGFVADDQ